MSEGAEWSLALGSPSPPSPASAIAEDVIAAEDPLVGVAPSLNSPPQLKGPHGATPENVNGLDPQAGTLEILQSHRAPQAAPAPRGRCGLIYFNFISVWVFFFLFLDESLSSLVQKPLLY